MNELLGAVDIPLNNGPRVSLAIPAMPHPRHCEPGARIAAVIWLFDDFIRPSESQAESSRLSASVEPHIEHDASPIEGDFYWKQGKVVSGLSYGCI